jgi:hypothetical protein
VERAEGTEVRARSFEWEIRADHLDNIVVLANLLKDRFRYEAGHGLIEKRVRDRFLSATAA